MGCGRREWLTTNANRRRESRVREMKWTGLYLFGYILLVCGLLGALWQLGLLANLTPAWTVIGVVILLGVGIMIAISSSGSKRNIEIDHT